MPRSTTSATARGYGYSHQQRRARVGRTVAAGNAVCWRCGKLIQPGTPWDLGHDDNDRSKYRGPEHQYCNRSAPGKRRGKKTRGGPIPSSARRWW